MIRRLLGFAVALLPTLATAGLQSAMTTALAGMSAAEIEIDAAGNNGLGLVVPTLPTPRELIDFAAADLRFVDPVNSTWTQPAYLSGPSATYDAATGGLSIFAPPLLGPADEFGNRQHYSATSITVAVGDRIAADATIPRVVSYRRNDTRRSDQLDPWTDPDPVPPTSMQSFLAAEDPYTRVTVGNFGYGRVIEVGPGFFFSEGASVEFRRLLVSALTDDELEGDRGTLADVTAWSLRWGQPADLAVSVSYMPREYGYQIFSFVFSARTASIAVPEPAAGLLSMVAFACFSAARGRRS
jgi:hypothetical protein